MDYLGNGHGWPYLLTHTAGFSYGFVGDDVMDRMYIDAELWTSKDLDEFVARLAKLPLRFDPGERYFYVCDMEQGEGLRDQLGVPFLPLD